MIRPKASILMPVYNAERYVGKAIESILNQTFTDFEFIIIDDGSTDNSLEILSNYARQDSRIRLIKNEGNQGLIYTLNKGLALACGEYIARMDADDISLPERLACQTHYLDLHHEIGVLGTNIAYINAETHLINEGKPKDASTLSPDVIRWMLLWRCPIYHPTVMLRREIIVQTGLRYDTDFRYAEDFELWTRLVRVTNITSLPNVLLYYRLIPESVSHVYRQEQRTQTHAIIQRELTTFLDRPFSQKAMETLINSFTKCNQEVSVDYVGAVDLLCLVYQQFYKDLTSIADQKLIEEEVAQRILTIGGEAVKHSPELAYQVLKRLRYVSFTKRFSRNVVKGVSRTLLKAGGIYRKTTISL